MAACFEEENLCHTSAKLGFSQFSKVRTVKWDTLETLWSASIPVAEGLRAAARRKFTSPPYSWQRLIFKIKLTRRACYRSAFFGDWKCLSGELLECIKTAEVLWRRKKYSNSFNAFWSAQSRHFTNCSKSSEKIPTTTHHSSGIEYAKVFLKLTQFKIENSSEMSWRCLPKKNNAYNKKTK